MTPLVFEFENLEPIEHFAAIAELPQNGNYRSFALQVNKGNISADSDIGIH